MNSTRQIFSNIANSLDSRFAMKIVKEGARRYVQLFDHESGELVNGRSAETLDDAIVHFAAQYAKSGKLVRCASAVANLNAAVYERSSNEARSYARQVRFA